MVFPDISEGHSIPKSEIQSAAVYRKGHYRVTACLSYQVVVLRDGNTVRPGIIWVQPNDQKAKENPEGGIGWESDGFVIPTARYIAVQGTHWHPSIARSLFV
jgi:hypothetical protein